MKETEFVTGEVRLSYPHVFNPHASGNFKGEPVFHTDILIPKSDQATLQRMQAAFDAAVTLGADTKWNGKSPKLTITDVLKDGDERDSEEYKGCWVIAAKAKPDYPPKVVDSALNPIIDHTEIYGGVYARVLVNFYPYNYNGIKLGVGCGLGAVQKLRDGDAFGGGSTSVESAFGVVTPQTPQVDPITGLPF